MEGYKTLKCALRGHNGGPFPIFKKLLEKKSKIHYHWVEDILLMKAVAGYLLHNFFSQDLAFIVDTQKILRHFLNLRSLPVKKFFKDLFI